MLIFSETNFQLPADGCMQRKYQTKKNTIATYNLLARYQIFVEMQKFHVRIAKDSVKIQKHQCLDTYLIVDILTVFKLSM